ncbi:MAG: AAA family ATPase [Anaerolineae bacterium]|nr:AAA family ATPase [Anaerolineae bacterium]
MSRRPTNPFSPDQPIAEEERFYGREDAIERIEDSLEAGERLFLVYGTPRIGKTSLLFRLRSRLAGRGTPVYVDLGAMADSPMRDLLWHIVLEAHSQIHHGREATPELSRDAFQSEPDYLQRELLPSWRRLLHGRPLIILLDGLELSRLGGGAWAELILRLRELVREEDLVVVAAVRGASTQRKEPAPALRGLPYLDLEPLTEVQTEELLVGTARYQLGFDYDALRRIHLLTGGHPYLVHVFGAELYRRLAPFGQVTIHIVGDMAPAVVGVASHLFAEEWDRLSREAQIVLATIGSMQGYRGTVGPWDAVVHLRRAGVERSPQAMEEALQELCGERVARWLGGSTYALRVELVRSWLADAHPLPEVLFGPRARRREPKAPRRRLAVDWGALLLWAGLGLAALVVARLWTSRSGSSSAIVPVPTLTLVRPTPRPTATRVPLPGRIAYMMQASPTEPWSIWTMRDNGTDPVRLSDGTSEDTMPAWSPDGTRVAFISSRSGNRDLWVMNADGTRLENVTRSGADEWTPAWSPDGLEIAFASYRDGNWEIYVCKPDGSQLRRLTKHGAADYAPSWSHDAGQLAFVSERDGNPEIYVINRDGTDLRRLTENQVTDLSPRWSPDGALIAFESYRDGNMEIYVMAPDGSNPRNVSGQPESDEHGPSWSPDGKWITYYSNADGSWDIFVMLADGSQKTNLTMSPAVEQAPAWQRAPDQ